MRTRGSRLERLERARAASDAALVADARRTLLRYEAAHGPVQPATEAEAAALTPGAMAGMPDAEFVRYCKRLLLDAGETWEGGSDALPR